MSLHTQYNANGIHEIRPKVLFEKLERRYPDRNLMFNVSIPSSGIGGMTLLESSILVSLAALLETSSFFEFGTFLGATTLLLAANSSAQSRITTLDLPPESVHGKDAAPSGDILKDGDANDEYLRGKFASTGACYIDRADQQARAKIRRLFKDSRQFDPAAEGLQQAFDFIFVDGGHDFETVSIDTRNALAMAREDAVIIWHDYRSQIHGDVTRFVDGFGAGHPIIHVQNTMLAFTFKGRFAERFSSL